MQRKHLTKSSILFATKLLREFPQPDKGCLKHTRTEPGDIVLNGERLDAFPLWSRTRQGCPFLPLPCNTVLEVLACKIREGEKKKRKGIHIEKTEVK